MFPGFDFDDETPTDPGNVERPCPRCDVEMIPLFSTFVCPDGCDRLARGRCAKCDIPGEAYAGTWLGPDAMHCTKCGSVWKP